MSSTRHFTTRRGFVAGMGFGGLGLYATWAAYGASPLPFATDHTDHHDHGEVAPMADMPGMGAMPGMEGGTRMSSEEFMHRHAEFLQRFQDKDGAVRPLAAPSDMSMASAHAGHGAMAMSMAMPMPATNPSDPIEVYFLAGRFSFEPDHLELRTGQPYRFQMMASDVSHGASIAFAHASRIVRLRPDTVTTLDLTFQEAGKHLVYCTVYCGPGHDGMRGLITVA